MTAAQVYAGYVRDMMDKQREFFRINRFQDLRGGREWSAALRDAKDAEKNVRLRTRDVLDSQAEMF